MTIDIHTIYSPSDTIGMYLKSWKEQKIRT